MLNFIFYAVSGADWLLRVQHSDADWSKEVRDTTHTLMLKLL